MKTNFKRIGKQSISIVLAVMMMLSTMLVGMVTSNAAISYWVLRGTFNDWKEIQFGGADGGSITYDLSAYKGTTVEFRTDAYENNKLNKNSTGDIVVAGTQYQLTWGKGDTMKYTVSSTGTGKVTFTVISQNGNNYLTVTEGDQPITVTPYYVAGENRLVNGKEWTPAQAEDKMSYDESSKTYSITYSNKSAGSYQFKLTKNKSWISVDDFTLNQDGCKLTKKDGNFQIETTNPSDITIKYDGDKTVTVTSASSAVNYKVTVDKNIANGTVTTSATSLAAGNTFKVTATPNDGYELDAITVKDASDNPINPNSDGSYTMPASNVTVSATFAPKPDCRLGFGYATGSSDTMGTFSCSSNGTSIVEGTYPYGTEVTFNAVAKEGYVFKGWYSDINGTDACLSTNTTYTFKLTKDTDVFAKFAEATGAEISGLYLIYSDSTANPSEFTKYLNLYCDSDNQVYAYFDSSIFDSSKEYHFMISNSAGKSTSWEYASDHYNNSVASSKSEYLKCGSAEWNLPKAGQSTYVKVKSATFNVLEDYADTVSGVKVNLGYYKDGKIVESSKDSSPATTYEIIPDVGAVSSRVKVYAKDGTIRANYQKYADMADTKITYTGDDVTKLKSEKYYVEGYAKLGSTIKVTTTIDASYRDKYYVKAFCVNGYSYGIINNSAADKINGVYTFNYTVPEDCTDKFIEITPIYYYIDDENTVTFYVEDFDETVQKTWGNTIAVQAWYNGGMDEAKDEEGKFDSLTKNALGGYPGQPLVYEGGKYSMQIPKYLNGVEANTVQGITLNNYIWDDVHSRNFTSQLNDNAQTYDYDDFYKLSETKDVDNIIFDFRYRTTTDNKPSQQGLSKSTYNKDELEPLKDYYGNIVDIFGNFLSENWTTDYDSNYLTVISNGYQKIEGIGDYATEWSVYDQTGNYITTINCSSLINKSLVHTDYEVAYDTLKNYAGKPVKIAYEKSFSDLNAAQKGTRADGRWYFSTKAQKITANVQIEYRTDDNSFVEDKFVKDSNVGTTTGAKAYFTNGDYNGKTTCEGTIGDGNFSVHAQTDDNANYYFIGWYLKTSEGYSFITNESDADFPMTNNETYVARFITTPSGTLTLSHTLLTGSADGKTSISAKIVDPNNSNKVIYTIPETSGNLVIPPKYVNYTSKYSIVATLKTVPYGNDEVEGFYNSDKVRYDFAVSGKGANTYVVSKNINELFEEVTDTQGNVLSYRLKKSNIPFYSNITSNPLEYKITYTYKTRLNGVQSYVIKDTVSGAELEKMWDENVAAKLPNKEQLSKAFIIRKAPFVSNYREEITWNMDAADIKGYTATVLANTTSVPDLNIYALNVNGQWTQPATVKYGELAKSNGDYLYKTGTNDFPEKFNGYDFSFWAIFDNKEKADQYRKEVVAYMSGKPAEVMSDRLTALTKLKGYDNLISKSYSKEYNYISYQDYYIVPVYAGRFAKDEINESQASIRLLKYTRNQWTNENGVKGDGSLNDNGSKTDYLYTDFALSFDKNQELIKNNANIKVGIAFEVVAKYADVENLEKYETGSDTAAIGSAVKKATKNGKVDSYTYKDANRDIYRYEINNSDISVKNRIEYYLRFKNSEKSQQNVMKVYSYIYDTKSGEIYLSDPVYMNMYDIGNLTYITSDLASIDLQSASELG